MSCELCELAPMTEWYGEFEEPFRFVLLDCDSCDVPMVVFGEHRATLSDEERNVMQDALATLAREKFGDRWFFDDSMKQIPDHYHCHARPFPKWWPPRSAS